MLTLIERKIESEILSIHFKKLHLEAVFFGTFMCSKKQEAAAANLRNQGEKKKTRRERRAWEPGCVGVGGVSSELDGIIAEKKGNTEGFSLVLFGFSKSSVQLWCVQCRCSHQ